MGKKLREGLAELMPESERKDKAKL